MEELNIDIENIKDAYEKLQEVMNDLDDIEDLGEGLIDNLNYIAEEINGLRITKERKIEEIQEENYLQKNKKQWEKEQKDINNEYWNSQF